MLNDPAWLANTLRVGGSWNWIGHNDARWRLDVAEERGERVLPALLERATTKRLRFEQHFAAVLASPDIESRVRKSELWIMMSR